MKRFKQRPFLYNASRMILAYRMYKRIVREVGKDTTILLAPHFATGDAYLIGSYMRAYVQAHCSQNKFIYLCVGQTCAKIISGMFHIKNIFVISMEERNLLEDLYRFLGDDKCRIRVLHYHGVCMYTGILGNMRAYKGLDFGRMLQYGAFQIPNDSTPTPPEFIDNKEFVEELFKKSYLEAGNTVIIAPSAVSADGLPEKFWGLLAVSLLNKGYKVCTNVVGATEPPIQYTRGIRFPLSCANQVIEKAGYFVGYRSGFCDIISTAKCKRAIIYPTAQMGTGKFLDYFGLKKMGLVDEVCELNYYPYLEQEIINTIIDYFEEIPR